MIAHHQAKLPPSSSSSSSAPGRHINTNLAAPTASSSKTYPPSPSKLRPPKHHHSYFRRRTLIAAMLVLSGLLVFLLISHSAVAMTPGTPSERRAAASVRDRYWHRACPDYKDYAVRRHPPFTTGQYQVPYQRPAPECRLFKSDAVEKKIREITSKMVDVDLARMFENCFPNTLDTTVRWHLESEDPQQVQSFIVTGDINAQWLRDSTNQLTQYQSLAKDDPALKTLLLGAINTQVDFVLSSPYCNAFQPPATSGLEPTSNGQNDVVHPVYEPDVVFECKYEIDSLASFLSLGNQYYSSTKDSSFITPKFLRAVQTVLDVIEEQSVGTFGPGGEPNDMTYTFQRQTNTGTETLNLAGIGNPLASNTSLVRSAFRPSDDACILQFFIPGNAFMSVELGRTAELLTATGKSPALAATLKAKSEAIRAAVLKYGVTIHPVFGKVFAYEVDGYGSHIVMDDANLPSLLSLPLMGFVGKTDEIYQNTRKMILSRFGNPYFLSGPEFAGIGGPHIGIGDAWPLSLLVQAMTSNDDDEIVTAVEAVLKANAREGLIHESVNVARVTDYTRPWFAWANSVFAQTILDIAERKPKLIFGEGAKLRGR